MRSLVVEPPSGGGSDIAEGGAVGTLKRRDGYERMLGELKKQHHEACVFNRQTSVIPDLPVWFDRAGVLHGTFTATELQQGYRGRMHGGVAAAIIDAAMAQCLMGHGICGYTVELSVKYRKPVLLHMPSRVRAWITGTSIGCLYEMKCEIHQGHTRVVGASGRFYRQHSDRMP